VVRHGLLVLVAISALHAGCNDATRADRPVLHEPVPDLKPNEAELVLAAAGKVASIEHRGRLITEPAGGALRAGEAPMTAAPATSSGPTDEPGVRSTVYTPDRQTSLEGSLPYFEVFTPTISPFKRVSALDRVVLSPDGVTPGLSTSTGRRVRVSIETPDAPAPDARGRDRFWGSVVLDFSAGETVPLPSVSPESRILSLSTDPPIPVRVERDEADNLFVVRGTRDAPDQVRVTFLTDAPQSYFGATIPSARADSLRDRVAPLERSIQRRAERFAAELNLRASDPLPDVLSALTEHFRSFVESKQPPTDTGDTYLDLARGKKGICRHRAYAFVVTAQALGIPTRFAQNEAHSWVEVLLPETGWMRIDLGGAANGLSPQNAQDQPAYRPQAGDPMPRPPEYLEAYAQAQRNAEATTQRAEDVSGDLARATGRWVEPSHDKRAGADGEKLGLGLSKRLPVKAEDIRGKQAMRITIDHNTESVYRGDTLQVTGHVTDTHGAPLSGMRIEVALTRPGQERSFLLGVVASAEDGTFTGSFGVGPSLAHGDYQLRVVSPGNDTYLPAVAR